MTSMMARKPAVAHGRRAPALALLDLIRPQNQTLAGRRILVVEDEMLVLMDIQDMLADLGCTAVVAVATVTQALQSISLAPPDAALLDLNLDGDRSYDVADALSEHHVPFAFATGYGAHGMRLQDTKRPLLVKPYQASDLARTLAGLLEIEL